eukprot:Gregarina_sp_Poly_1__6388@NODE_3404_length_1120_cov_5_226971_g2152_i0_p1_GENE_NODE_3404_length_1120_cov_5_226971_g2152_i0NODE_3404_length_1120_cov_5_226971_g2152_i0_p1_ORF_typecomplete_len316_score41_53ZU5/PF00791_20/0_071_NODE_3404_length_1120_cov_5_226971_g2152_i016963
MPSRSAQFIDSSWKIQCPRNSTVDATDLSLVCAKDLHKSPREQPSEQNAPEFSSSTSKEWKLHESSGDIPTIFEARGISSKEIKDCFYGAEDLEKAAFEMRAASGTCDFKIPFLTAPQIPGVVTGMVLPQPVPQAPAEPHFAAPIAQVPASRSPQLPVSPIAQLSTPSEAQLPASPASWPFRPCYCAHAPALHITVPPSLDTTRTGIIHPAAAGWNGCSYSPDTLLTPTPKFRSRAAAGGGHSLYIPADALPSMRQVETRLRESHSVPVPGDVVLFEQPPPLKLSRTMGPHTRAFKPPATICSKIAAYFATFQFR